jgi:RNA polymerase sigma-70 factor (ECF subfamily)
MDPQTLLERARRGDRQAWNDLLAWMRPLLRAVLRQRMRGREEASDVTNEAQIRMHKGFGQFRGETLGQFRVWAGRIAANALADHFRRDPDEIASLAFDPPCHRRPPEPHELSDRLARALARLPEDQRRVVEARLFDGLQPSEIAARFGWPAGRVRVYYLRAIENLSQQLRGES